MQCNVVAVQAPPAPMCGGYGEKRALSEAETAICVLLKDSILGMAGAAAEVRGGLLLLLLPGYRRGTILWHLTSSRAP